MTAFLPVLMSDRRSPRASEARQRTPPIGISFALIPGVSGSSGVAIPRCHSLGRNLSGCPFSRGRKNSPLTLFPVDAEHRKLFDLLRKLHDAIVIGCTRNTLNSIIADLLKTAEMHFDNEERLMKEHGYAGLEAHRGEHQKIARDVKTLVVALSAGKLAGKPDIALLPAQWLYSHIRTHDKLYVSHIAQAARGASNHPAKRTSIPEPVG